jgi:hypothetical protein
MRTCTLAFFLFLGGCTEKKTPPATDIAGSSTPTTAAAKPTEDPVAKEKVAIAAATKRWLSLYESWKSIAVVADPKAKTRPGACTKTSPPSTQSGVSIGFDQVIELAASGAPHNALFYGGGTTSDRLSTALRIPFMESERRTRDWSPSNAVDRLTAIEKSLFPLTVIRIDDFVSPELTGKNSFRSGNARATIFLFESATSACTISISVTSDKSVAAMTIDGQTGGADVVNRRLANALEQSVQRAAGLKLAELGKIGSLEPVVKN